MTRIEDPLPMGGWAATTESWFVDEMVDLGDALALRSPSDPTFRWGNLLVLKEPMEAVAREPWERRFRAAFADVPGIQHATFAWQGADGALTELEAAGYEPDRNVVRIGRPTDLASAPTPPAGFAVRLVQDEAGWQSLRDLDAADAPPSEDLEAFMVHRDARWRVYRDIAGGARSGLTGGYYLVTVNGEVAGSVGLYVRGGVGRFQYVHVAPAFRRMGVATAMMHAVAREGFTTWRAHRLVIIADEGEAPDRIYARLGFPVRERYVGACLRVLPPA